MIVRMPRLHAAQDRVRRHPARFKVVDCGRRWGKTLLAATLAFSVALAGGAVWWIGPTSREAGIGWKRILPMAKQIPGATIKYAKNEIHFPGGGWIAVLSAESATLRGEGLDLVIIDEAAYLADLRRVWYGDLRPALADRGGAAVFVSTPAGRNFFYELYMLGQNGEPGWASWQMPTSTNPFIARDEIAAARRVLPGWYFAQEFEAAFQSFAGKVYKEFSPDSPLVFTLDGVSAYREFWGGIDFGFRNPTVAVVGGIDRDDRLDVIDGLYQREMTTPDLIAALRKMQAQYRVCRWFADPSEPGVIKELVAAGLPVVGAPRVQGELDRGFLKGGIVKVETRMVNGLFRVARHLTDVVREIDVYRYAEGRDGAEEKEAPLKVDDHAPDAVRYMVVGLDHLRGRVPQIWVAA